MKTKHKFGFSIAEEANEDGDRWMYIKNKYSQTIDALDFESTGDHDKDLDIAADLLDQWIELNGEFYEWGTWYV